VNDLLRLLTQVGRLKALRRAGWVRSGLPDPESVADHSFRTAVLALVLAGDLGVDAQRLLSLVLVHDLPESDPAVGDITPYCGVDRDEKRRRERLAMERLCDGVPAGDHLHRLWLEYDDGLTPESRVAHELDALEMALQAREYQARHGADLSEFLDSARGRITHPALLHLLDEP
jgi:5'-deoxynucleotidase YfbR-like HD superfamily hydrolase